MPRTGTLAPLRAVSYTHLDVYKRQAHSGTNDLPFAFMGDYGVWSAGNGLYLTRHRAYDANLMRFLQPDPIGLEGGYNLYALSLIHI